MGTEILKSFGSLQNELEQAKNSLKGVDENIKRLIGRDPSDLPPRPGPKKISLNDDRGRPILKNNNRNRNFQYENDEPPNKRRNTNVSVFKRLSDRPVYDDVHHGPQRQMISKVIVTPKEIPSREEALEAQNKDEKFKARNRRMFGALLGTLQKFQQEETKLKPKEEKRAQLEKKIEEHEIKEKEEIKKERQELFLNRKKKQAQIKMIEIKMVRMKEHAAWEERQKPRGNFILTKTKPQIHYLPRRLNDKTKELLENTKAEVEKIIEKKWIKVLEDLQNIEDRMKKNVDIKFGAKEEKEEISDKKMEKKQIENKGEDFSTDETSTYFKDKENDEVNKKSAMLDVKPNEHSVNVDVQAMDVCAVTVESEEVSKEIKESQIEEHVNGDSIESKNADLSNKDV